MSSETIDELRKIEEKESKNMILSKDDFSKLPEAEQTILTNRISYCTLLGIMLVIEPTLDEILPLAKGGLGGEVFDKCMKGIEDAFRIPHNAMLYTSEFLSQYGIENYRVALDSMLTLIREYALKGLEMPDPEVEGGEE